MQLRDESHCLGDVISFNPLMIGIRLIDGVRDRLEIDAFMADTSYFMMLIDCYSTDGYFLIVLQKTTAQPGWPRGQPALCRSNF